jgi:hypothetical protein
MPCAATDLEPWGEPAVDAIDRGGREHREERVADPAVSRCRDTPETEHGAGGGQQVNRHVAGSAQRALANMNPRIV